MTRLGKTAGRPQDRSCEEHDQEVRMDRVNALRAAIAAGAYQAPAASVAAALLEEILVQG